MGEYKELKGKFDKVVAELKKLKKEMSEVYSSYDELEKKDSELESSLTTVKKSYAQQLESLVKRVDQLSSQLSTQQSASALQARQQQSSSSSQGLESEVEQQLSQLKTKISALEKALAEAPIKLGTGNPSTNTASSATPESKKAVNKLKEVGQLLENTSKDLKVVLKDLPQAGNPSGQNLVSRLDSCGKKIGQLSQTVQLSGDNPGHNPGNHNPGNHNPGNHNPGNHNPGNHDGGGSDVVAGSASSMARCMQEIKERIQEIGEQLDCLEDEAEDSDVEDGDATAVEDVRERLANLCEYIKQHSKFSDYDWRLRQLLEMQKSVICNGDGDGESSKDKLQAYADRLSLESLVLVEMSHLLENKEGLLGGGDVKKSEDPVLRELGNLNSKLLNLHCKLDSELRTLCSTEATDVLRVQADIMAEKILLEGHLCSATFSQDSQEEKDVQPKLLAVEALLRSQLDSYVGHNLDKSCDELWSSASHLTTRSLVQGELTFALANLKKQLTDSEVTQSSTRDIAFERLICRHKAVTQVAEVYQEKMVGALAVIIHKESEEMTLVEGPENVLDAVCSEVSTIMETHIQRCKEKVRGSHDTHTARRFDMMVNRLRADREVVLASIRQQHDQFSADPDSECDVELPFQSLDSSINNFGEIMSLCSILAAHLDFVTEMLKMGDISALAEMEVEEEEEEEGEEEEDGAQKALQKGLSSFVHELAEALQKEAVSKQAHVSKMLDQGEISIAAASIPTVFRSSSSEHRNTLAREAVFAAQTTFMMYKMKLLHEQEMDALRAARPVRAKPQRTTDGEESQEEGESDFYQALVPLEEVLDTKYDDEMETLRVIASQVGKLEGAMQGHNWTQVEEHVRQLEQKVQDELGLAQQRHDVHLDLFKQEESKVERVFEETQQERDHFEERSEALEAELRAVTIQHDDEVERMRQDVMTAVSAIRANEEESETALGDKVQVLTKQLLLQKDKYKRFLGKMKSQLAGTDAKDKDTMVELVAKELKDINNSSELADDEELPPLPSQPPPDAPHKDDKTLNVEEELELLKKEKDEALAEETRNTKAALDAMRKAYEEELQHERSKYRECLTTMYNEDFVSEIRHRHQQELEKTQEELKQVKMHYYSKCEDLKLLEVKLGQTKQDYESHINQLITSNDRLDDMVNQEIERLKDFIKSRPTNLTTGNATMEEELYDAQIMIRVKDAELQKLRSQVKNLENSLHRTTEEHRQTMTQYLQALKENQENRKEYQGEVNSLREQLEKVQSESGLRRPIRRTPSFHQRARSPSPSMAGPQRRDSTSTSEHASRDANRRSRRIDPKDLRRSKSSPSLPYVFDAKGNATAVKSPGKDRRPSQKT